MGLSSNDLIRSLSSFVCMVIRSPDRILSMSGALSSRGDALASVENHLVRNNASLGLTNLGISAVGVQEPMKDLKIPDKEHEGLSGSSNASERDTWPARSGVHQRPHILQQGAGCHLF